MARRKNYGEIRLVVFDRKYLENVADHVSRTQAWVVRKHIYLIVTLYCMAINVHLLLTGRYRGDPPQYELSGWFEKPSWLNCYLMENKTNSPVILSRAGMGILKFPYANFHFLIVLEAHRN